MAASPSVLRQRDGPLLALGRRGYDHRIDTAPAGERLGRTNGVTIRSTSDCLITQLSLRDRLPVLTKDRDFSAISRCCPLLLVTLN
ncbi:hypothetical protein CKO40_21095 [Halochromatium glycolicum]|uniref:PIN domain-containing protein n=1 Tax=Halochromatium glycolicum TaxID=85075 RepID=A0AAJ0U7X4_9GAMM|nr:hypothetical protein [Halochromatium glycolicum]